MVLGFFMILVDTTIVSVANPAIMAGLDTTMTATLWATSAYLLAYAVPLLITGRLGDRFGPRNLYLWGLAVFTVASLACGLAHSIEMLIIARVFQGLGAAMITPQTMAVITRIFGPRERGSAMAIWGVTAGVATLVGPILGGFLIDAGGWEWIFFVNLPVGIIALVLGFKYVPRLPTSAHGFDWLGVVLSAVGMFLVVFGIQEGESYDWGVIFGFVTVPMLIIAGVVLLALFVLWQWKQKGEPLIPLEIFKDRNFSVGTAAILTVGFAVTAQAMPLMFFFQLVLGMTPTTSALMLTPMAVLSIALARPVGLLLDRREPRRLASIGMLLVGGGLAMYYFVMSPDTPIWQLLAVSCVLGAGNAFMWGPLSSITTFGLEPRLAGAGSGVYNTSRQVGSVVGSAAITVLMASLLATQLGAAAGAAGEGAHMGGQLPEIARAPYAEAMAQSLLLPIAVIAVGLVVTLFFGKRPAKTHGA